MPPMLGHGTQTMVTPLACFDTLSYISIVRTSVHPKVPDHEGISTFKACTSSCMQSRNHMTNDVLSPGQSLSAEVEQWLEGVQTPDSGHARAIISP